MKAKIIAIVNQKGGVGKTTTALNLGVGLGQAGKRVLLVDADPQSSLTISMGIQDPDSLPVTLHTVMQSVIEDKPLPHNYGIIHNGEGVDLLPSDIELSGMEMSLYGMENRGYVLRSSLSELRRNYDYILIDCMPFLGLVTINALAAADSVIIPTQPNYLSTKGLDLLLRSISKVRHGINPRLQIDGILFTAVKGGTNNAKQIIASLREAVQENIRVFNTEIPSAVKVEECALHGKSIFSHNRRSKAAAAYKLLTQEVIQIEQRQKNRPRTDGVR